MPAQLELKQEGPGVVAKELVGARTRFGPFEAPRIPDKRTQGTGFDLKVICNMILLSWLI